MSARRSPFARCLAAAAAVALLFAVAPTTASAAETPNPWKLWVEDLGDREHMIEVPFLVLVSIGPMVAITPIWLGKLAYGAMKGDKK